MRIAICDDEAIFRNIVHEECTKYFIQKKESYEIEEFNNGIELLESVLEYDILFLDVEMPSISGVEVAKKLRDKGCKAYIVFLTGYVDFMQTAFKVKAFRYLMKPLAQEEFYEAMNEIRKELYENAMINLPSREGQVLVKLCDILYIESLGEQTSVYTKDAHYICKYTLKCWTEKLDATLFFQTDRAHIMGIRYYRGIKESKVNLSYNMEVPVARRRKTELKKMYEEYVLSRAV